MHAPSCVCFTLLQGEWLYMIESDYVFMKPLPLPDAASQVPACLPARPAAHALAY